MIASKMRHLTMFIRDGQRGWKGTLPEWKKCRAEEVKVKANIEFRKIWIKN